MGINRTEPNRTERLRNKLKFGNLVNFIFIYLYLIINIRSPLIWGKKAPYENRRGFLLLIKLDVLITQFQYLIFCTVRLSIQSRTDAHRF